LLRNRAIFHTGTATRTQIHFDEAGAFADFDLEIAGISLNRFQICVGDQFDVQMPADLDQYRGDNSHGAVIGRKGLVQLGHDAANGRGFFKQIHIIAGIGQIQGGLHSGNTTADNQYRTYGAVRHDSILLNNGI
jgi:hypothetical protein